MTWSTVRRVAFAALVVAPAGVAQRPGAGFVSSEFVYDTASFASAHASTIVETPSGLAAAWFGGSREGANDVGIWLARQVDGKWTAPTEVANGVEAGGVRYPCWNPVLFSPARGTLLLFYKVGPRPAAWWGMLKVSHDAGRTWSAARRLPDGIIGPVKNKPVLLADGSILAASSTESMDAPSLWRVHFERTADLGETWSRSEPAAAQNGEVIDAIQPSLLMYRDGRIQALGRTRSGRVFETWSADSGRSWTALSLTPLLNPNSGIDAVTLRDGRQLIVYNRSRTDRSPLNIAVSGDGKRWEEALVLERDPGEFSYPAVIQTSDGLVHVTYTWNRRRIRHVVIDPSKLRPTSTIFEPRR